MKVLTLSNIIGLAFLLSAIGFSQGCASDSYGHLLTPQLAQAAVVATNLVTQTNQVTVTNQVVQTVTQTNGVTVVETNQVTQTNVVVEKVPVLVTNTVTVTNGWQVSSTVSNIVGYAQMANGATAALDPYSVPIGGILAGGLGLLGWYARLKTKQAQQHLSTATTMITAIEGLAPTVVAGVKAAVAAQALHSGTTNEVNATVQAVVNALPASPGTATS